MAAPGKSKNIFEKIGLKKDQKEPSYGKKAADNRAAGEAIAAELESIDFFHCDYKGKTEEDSPQMMYRKTAVLIKVLKNSPTICDNIKGMDEILLYAAQALAEAIRNNDYNKAIWAKNALCTGVLYLRDNVPADKSDVNEEVLEARLKYMKNYKTIIQMYEKADAKEKAVKEFDRMIKEKHESYDPKVAEIKALKETVDGMAILGKLKLNEISPDSLNEEDRRVLEMVRVAAAEAHTIYTLNSSRTAAQVEYETAIEEAADVRTVLVNKPNVFNKELTALHALAMEEQIKSIANAFAEASVMIDSVVKSDAKLKAVMNGADAQKVQQHAVSFIEKVLNGEGNEDADAIREGSRMAKHANEAEEARKQAEAEAEAEMSKVKNFVDNIDLTGLFSKNDDIDFSADKAGHTEMAEDENINMNFNYNS